MESIFVKVALLLTMSMLGGAAGTWCGRNIRSGATMIGLGIAFILGTIGVFFAAHAGAGIGIAALAAWTFVSGLFIGPVINSYKEELGWQTVGGIFAGTAGVMAVCGIVGLFSGVDFSGMGTYLMFALFGLIIVGVIGIFVRLSRTINIVYSILGMIIFSGYFLFDFWRLGHSENTWEKAIGLTMSLYLDFLNFFLHALQLYSQLHHK
jgi:FtsH-binding integral membrane protein